MLVVHDIVFLPVLDPISDQEDLYLSFLGGANDAIEASIDDHLLADEAGKSVKRFIFSQFAGVQIHVSAEKTDTGARSVDDGVLLRMNTPTQLIAVPMWNVQLIPQAIAMFETVFGFSWSTCVTCADDLVIANDDSPDGPAKTGAVKGDFSGNI